MDFCTFTYTHQFLARKQYEAYLLKNIKYKECTYFTVSLSCVLSFLCF